MGRCGCWNEVWFICVSVVRAVIGASLNKNSRHHLVVSFLFFSVLLLCHGLRVCFNEIVHRSCAVTWRRDWLHGMTVVGATSAPRVP